MDIDVGWLQQQFPDLSGILPLGSGAFKAVFAARHPVDGDVVLKLIKPTQDPEDVSREVLAVAQVDTTRVPVVLEHGCVSTVVGDCCWLREQRVTGHTVRECLTAGPFAAEDVLRMGLHVLEALAGAEKARVVHRDVKPDNIMRDDQGDFWLLDFGIARHLQLESRTDTARPFGKFTPGYAPPEQFRNIKAAIDSRSDLFALGVTLCECATGRNPFRDGARDDLEILGRVERMSPLALPSGYGMQFSDLVSAMTQKRCDQRPRSVQYALEWMREIWASEQV